ncbi:hypothetical protein CSV76_12820 [Sporosarcina sp. P17b]|nr:hypothetical protein CSV76_12820 [Sporosarcina sp. P17b]
MIAATVITLMTKLLEILMWISITTPPIKREGLRDLECSADALRESRPLFEHIVNITRLPANVTVNILMGFKISILV